MPTEPDHSANPETPAAEGKSTAWLRLEPSVQAGASTSATPTRWQQDPRFPERSFTEQAPAIAGYEVVRLLGRGGMGIVYLARHIGLNRRVALKMMLAGAHAGANELARFHTEAQAVAQLVHPNIVQIYEVGEHDGLPFCALEFIEGGSLEQWLDGRPQSAAVAAHLMEALASAVQAAHAKGIIHRDLKPDNVLLSFGDRAAVLSEQPGAGPVGGENPLLSAAPKISDFGLAKSLEGGSAQTRTGDVIGTPSYMAPEQAAGDNTRVGPAADIYALGAILYEMLTGRAPFAGVSPTETLIQVLTVDPVPPRRLQAAVPLDLETICLKCLQRKPEQRYADAAALAADLRRFRSGQPILARPTGPLERARRWCARKPAVAALMATILLLLVMLAIGGPMMAFHQADLRRQTEGHERAAERSAEEAIRAKDESDQRLIRLHIATGANALQAGELMTALLWYGHAWARDPHAAENEPSHRQRVAAVLGRMPRLEGICFHAGPVFDAVYDPNFHRLVTRTDAAEAYLWDPYESRLLATLPHAARVAAVAAAPDGRIVATGSDDRTARLWDAASGKPLGGPLMHPAAVRAVAFAPDGATLATASADRAIRFWRVADGQPLTRTIQVDGEPYFIAYNPGGARLLTAHKNGGATLWDAAAGTAVAAKLPHESLVFDPALENRPAPVFTGDGKRLLTAAGARVYVWDGLTGAALANLDVASRNIKHLAVSANGDLGSVHVGSGAYVFRLDSGQHIHSAVHPRETALGCFCATPAGLRLVSASSHGLGHSWSFKDGVKPATQLPNRFRHAGQITWLCYDAARNRVLAAGSDGTARVWALDRPPIEETDYDFTGGRANQLRNVPGVAYSADGKWALRFGGPGPMRAERHDGPAPAVDFPAAEPVRRAVFSADGRRVVAVGERAAQAWDFPAARTIGPPIPLAGALSQLWLTADGGRALAVLDRQTGDQRNAVLAWDTNTGRQLLDLRDPELSGPPPSAREFRRTMLSRCAISPDGRRAALAGGWFGLLQIIDLDTGQRSAAVGHKGFVSAAEFSPDGRRVVSASSDATARLWDAATGLPDGPVLRHNSFVRDAAFAPDGRRVATVLGNGTINVWDAVTGDLLIEKLGGGDLVAPIWFTRAGLQVVAQSTSGKTRQIRLPALGVSAEHVPAVVRLMTGQRLDETNDVDLLEEDEFRRHRAKYEEALAAWRRSAEDTRP